MEGDQLKCILSRSLAPRMIEMAAQPLACRATHLDALRDVPGRNNASRFIGCVWIRRDPCECAVVHRDPAIHIRYCTCIARSYAPLPPSASPSPVMSSASFSAPAGNTDPNVEQCPYCRKPYKKRGYHQHVEACSKRKHMQALEDLRLQEQLEVAQA